jgi:hypothetical protein
MMVMENKSSQGKASGAVQICEIHTSNSTSLT